MNNAIIKYFQDKRRKEERERQEQTREITQRSQKTQKLKDEVGGKPSL